MPRKQTNHVVLATDAPQLQVVVDNRKVPSALRFPLLVLFNLSLSTLLYSLTSQTTTGYLSAVSRSLNEWGFVVGIIGYKAAELAVGWWGRYDGKSRRPTLVETLGTDNDVSRL